MKKFSNDIQKQKTINQKLYFFYKILANDLLFYYAISYLFLVEIKGLNTSQIVFADALYPLFKLLLQLPCTVLIQKIGKKNSLLIANTGIAIYLIFILRITNLLSLIIANIFCALGFVIKSIAESNFLYDSLDDTKNKKEEFSKYESNSLSKFFFLDAITTFITGFIYIINPYFPLILSLLLVIISIIINLNFYEISDKNNVSIKDDSLNNQLNNQFKDLSQAFKFIFSSSRLKALILFNSLFNSLLILMVTLHKSILNDVNVSSEYLGIIFALMGIVISFSSSKSLHFHKKYTNRTLAFLGILLTISIILSGLVTLLNLTPFFTYYLLLISISIVYIVKGPFYTLIKQYLNSFCNSDLRIKIYSANLLIEYISTSSISMLCSLILNYFSNSFTTLLIGICSFVIMLILIKYMSTRVRFKTRRIFRKRYFL